MRTIFLVEITAKCSFIIEIIFLIEELVIFTKGYYIESLEDTFKLMERAWKHANWFTLAWTTELPSHLPRISHTGGESQGALTDFHTCSIWDTVYLPLIYQNVIRLFINHSFTNISIEIGTLYPRIFSVSVFSNSTGLFH